MKASFKIILVLVGLAISNISFAQYFEPTEVINVSTENYHAKLKVFPMENKIWVLITKPENASSFVNIKIRDEKNQELALRKMGKKLNNLAFVVNLNAVVDGNYTVEIEDKDGIKTSQIKKSIPQIVSSPISYLEIVK